MKNEDLFNAANALSTLAISAVHGHHMVKSALDSAAIGAAGGAAGAGLAGAGLGGLLAGIGQPDETDEDKAKLKNRRLLAALGLGVPAAAVGGYLGSQQAPAVDKLLSKVNDSSVVQYLRRLMMGKHETPGPEAMGLPLQAAPEILAGAPQDATLHPFESTYEGVSRRTPWETKQRDIPVTSVAGNVGDPSLDSAGMFPDTSNNGIAALDAAKVPRFGQWPPVAAK